MATARFGAMADMPPDAEFIDVEDGRYPPLLRTIHDPPAGLFIRGDVSALARPQLAIVGSRKASPAALRLTQTLVAGLCDAGLAICSGLALGIDGAAHQAALDVGGTTVAVMGTGIEQLYPARHTALAQQLCTRGCLVTEFPPGTPPRRGNFPKRNRIISGMSVGVLVVEAAERSGTLITARSALEQGREVFALPWSIAHEGGLGCLSLLRDGAKMVLSVEDILEELAPLLALQREKLPSPLVEPQPPPSNRQDDAPLDSAQRKLLAHIGYECVSLSALLDSSGMPVSEALSVLSELELLGYVGVTGAGYVRC